MTQTTTITDLASLHEQLKQLAGGQTSPMLRAIAERMASSGNPMLGGNPMPIEDSLMVLDANNTVRDWPIGIEQEDWDQSLDWGTTGDYLK